VTVTASYMACHHLQLLRPSRRRHRGPFQRRRRRSCRANPDSTARADGETKGDAGLIEQPCAGPGDPDDRRELLGSATPDVGPVEAYGGRHGLRRTQHRAGRCANVIVTAGSLVVVLQIRSGDTVIKIWQDGKIMGSYNNAVVRSGTNIKIVANQSVWFYATLEQHCW